jgi:hypothetical protein
MEGILMKDPGTGGNSRFAKDPGGGGAPVVDPGGGGN